MLHDLHEDDHRGEAISGRISTSRIEHHEPLLAIPEVTNRCILASGQSLQRCIAHLDQLIRVETVKIFEQSSKSFFFASGSSAVDELARLDEFVAMPRLCSRSTFLQDFPLDGNQPHPDAKALLEARQVAEGRVFQNLHDDEAC